MYHLGFHLVCCLVAVHEVSCHNPSEWRGQSTDLIVLGLKFYYPSSQRLAIRIQTLSNMCYWLGFFGTQFRYNFFVYAIQILLVQVTSYVPTSHCSGVDEMAPKKLMDLSGREREVVGIEHTQGFFGVILAS